MSTPWFLQRMAALDFESSDKDPSTARIVTCALILVGGGQETITRTWLLNPGIPMEPGAIKVHGITDEYAAEHGQDAEAGIASIGTAIADAVDAGLPLVGHNLGGYDLNLLNAELRRHHGSSIDILCGSRLRVIDTMVLDKHCAPYRRRVSETQGPYQMRTTAETYGLGWDVEQAHGAEYDALMSARAAYRMGVIAHTPREDRPGWVRALRNRRGPYEQFDDLKGVTVEGLHQRQIGWARERAEGLRTRFASQGDHDKAKGVRTEWPLIPAPRGGDAS